MSASARAHRALWMTALAGLVLVTDVRGGAAPPLPGPAPRRRPAGFDAAAESAACEACHADIAREWRSSLHHQSWDDPTFQAAYAIEPLGFCRGCHAPEAEAARRPEIALGHLGVGCVTCHVEEGEVIGVRDRARSGLRHAVRGDARLASSVACEGCHQFDFPRAQPAPMQGTADEHRAGKYASTPCQTCHMPVVTSAGVSHRRHDFRVLGDAAMLRSAISARAERSSDRAVTVTLAVARAGHAVPTGDMLRRIVVRAWAGGDGARLEAAPQVFSRRFVNVRRGDGFERREVGDERLPATGAPERAWLWFAEPVARREVHWEVVYQRMDPGTARLFRVDLEGEEVILAEGTLAPGRARR